MRHSTDVGIVGAGPAGTRAAELLARQGVEVVLLDPRAPWEKPCGGGLTASLMGELPQLLEVEGFLRPIERAWVELSENAGVEVALDEPIWMISREDLGAWQLERALEAGATHEAVKVRDLSRTRRGWLLETDDGALRVRYLVGADGAASRVRRSAAPHFSVDLAPTRVAYSTDPAPLEDTLVLRFFPGIVGYLWDFPRPDHRSIGIMVPHATWRRPQLDEEVDRYYASTGARPEAASVRTGAVIGTAQLGHGDFSQVAGPRFALLGDAAGFADPLTGEGIQNAFRSADLLAEAWRTHGPDAWRVYPSLARDAFGREFAQARRLRRSLGESGAGVKLLGWAVRSKLAHAAVAAALNTVGRPGGSLRELSIQTYRAIERLRDEPARGSRVALRRSGAIH